MDRGLERKPEKIVPHICVDETASKKGHNYVTIVSDPATGTVLHVSEGRTIESLLEYYDRCSPEQIAGIESVSMDMWPAYITATRMRIPDARLHLTIFIFLNMLELGWMRFAKRRIVR